eukprot:361927-Chlamydomonas_euryale.AAC.11
MLGLRMFIARPDSNARARKKKRHSKSITPPSYTLTPSAERPATRAKQIRPTRSRYRSRPPLTAASPARGNVPAPH